MSQTLLLRMSCFSLLLCAMKYEQKVSFKLLCVHPTGSILRIVHSAIRHVVESRLCHRGLNCVKRKHIFFVILCVFHSKCNTIYGWMKLRRNKEETKTRAKNKTFDRVNSKEQATSFLLNLSICIFESWLWKSDSIRAIWFCEMDEAFHLKFICKKTRS